MDGGRIRAGAQPVRRWRRIPESALLAAPVADLRGLAGRRAAPEQDVVPARQPLARLRLVALRGGALLPALTHRAPRSQHGERRHGRNLLGLVGVVIERRART